MGKVETAGDLDSAVAEREALEELGELAARWAPKLAEDSGVRRQLTRLLDLAPESPRAA